MNKNGVEQYLQQGIYGIKEVKSVERKKYLGTLRERVIAVLYQSQVSEKEVYPEIIHLIRKYPKACLFLNGHMTDSYLSKYMKLASLYKIRYKMVFNKDYNSEFGLVLAAESAINEENIYIEKKFEQEIIKKKNTIWNRLFRFLKT